MDLINLLKIAINASVEGGTAIMSIYNSDFNVEYKEDASPLTIADKKCNQVIESILSKTNIPILSEEGAKIAFEERSKWEYFWLIDPLDGTKEFIKRNGEFTVNIALVHNGAPIIGVIYVPAKVELYFASEKTGSYRTGRDCIIDFCHSSDNLESLMKKSEKLPINYHYNRDNYVIVGSRSHMSIETEQFFKEKKQEYDKVEVVSIGSSLKLCMVAEGIADAYPRYAPTMEWDTAAGHAIAKFAGFSVNQYNTKEELIYNKKDLLNPWFLVS